MKTTLLGRLSGLLKITAALAVVTLISACASLDAGRSHTVSSIPIEVVQSGSGHVLSFRAHESASRLYVSGTAKEQPLTIRTHVDVQLLSASGKVIAEKRDDIDPQHPAAGGGRRAQGAFVASFPLSEARQAARIRVTYHAQHP
jgi:hypothetical protein